jgi:NAD(P)-dependent dehydrogenase (short-subunit alcohol dehydrogenase family)/uncharacterized OB-fold protein
MRQPVLPPARRSRVALGMTAAAAAGRFELQVCEACGSVQYPPREMCYRCLHEGLVWREQDGGGELIAATTLLHSHDLYFRQQVPWRIGLVRLDSGPSVVVHLHGDVPAPPARVRVGARLDKAAMAVLVGFPEKDVPNMADDRQLREMTCDPKYRKVLVTDGRTAVGQALVRALAAAGADLIWVGHAESWQTAPGLADLAQLPQVALVPLDLTNARSVTAMAGELGGRVDILINNAEFHRARGILAHGGTATAHSEMDVNYFGLLRLAQAFGPAMRARGADGQASAVAWVNLLSIFALSNFPSHGTYSASKAAALSLAQGLRAEMRAGGVRVVNVFPGPLDDEWHQLLPPPKLAPEALARAVVSALKDGIEDVYPGEVAQEWLQRYRESPKVLERELAAG